MKEKLIILIEDKVKETEKEIDSYNESDKTKKVLKEKMLNCKKQLIKWIDLFGVPENYQVNITAFGELLLLVRKQYSVLAKEHFALGLKTDWNLLK